MNPLDSFKEVLVKECLATGDIRLMPKEALAKGLCCACGEPALPKCYSELGRREYRISAYCEPCFDALFEDTDK